MTERIELLLKSINLSPSRFADEIDVQRSSVSHILSGRNKPSLDFITKVLTTYPQVNPDWLLFNKGGMIRKSDGNSSDEYTEDQKKDTETKVNRNLPTTETDPINHLVRDEEHTLGKNRKLEKVILLYSDGTFKNYKSG